MSQPFCFKFLYTAEITPKVATGKEEGRAEYGDVANEKLGSGKDPKGNISNCKEKEQAETLDDVLEAQESTEDYDEGGEETPQTLNTDHRN